MAQQVGRITLVQEGRFQMDCDDGRTLLFILGHDAAVEPQDLPALQRRGCRLAIEADPAPSLVAQVAHRIRILDETTP